MTEAQINDMIQAAVGFNKVKMPAAVVADYAAFSAAVASSTGTEIAASMLATGTVPWFGAAQYLRIGFKLGASSALIGKKIKKVTWRLRKVGAPTGTITVTVRDSADTIKGSVALMDISALTTTFADYTATFASAITLASGDRVLIEYSGGNVSNRGEIEMSNSDVYDGTNTFKTGYISGYTDETSRDVYAIVEVENQQGNVIDGNTATYWLSAPEAQPNIYGDIGSDKLVSGCRIYWHTNNRPTNHVIEVSRDAATWTEVLSETAQPAANAYKEYAFNTTLARYVRVKRTDAGSTVLQVAEMQYYSKTIEQVVSSHGHGSAS